MITIPNYYITKNGIQITGYFLDCQLASKVQTYLINEYPKDRIFVKTNDITTIITNFEDWKTFWEE